MYVDTLASFYENIAGPPGIPWDGLIAKGRGLTEDGYDPAYMELMLNESMKFFNVLGTLSPEFRDKYRHIRNDEARKAITQMLALIDQTGADVWQAVKDGNWDATVGFPQSIAVDVFATLAASAANGAYLHFDGVIESAMRAGKITPEEVMKHADWIVKTFRVFVDMNKNGHLSQFKEGGQQVAGLGNPVIVGWVVALGIVVVLGGCYLYYVHRIAAPVQEKVFEWCDKLAKNPNASDADIRACIAAAVSMQENGNGGLGNFLGDAIKPIVVVAGIGLAIYVASIVVPMVKVARRVSA